jgi:hypothetical protein
MGTVSEERKEVETRLVMHEPKRQETSLPPPLRTVPSSLPSATALDSTRPSNSHIPVPNPIETRRVVAHSLINSVTYMFPMTMTNPRYHDNGLPLSLVLMPSARVSTCHTSHLPGSSYVELSFSIPIIEALPVACTYTVAPNTVP